MKLIWYVSALFLLLTTYASGATIKDEHRIVDADGKTLAIVVSCRECKSESKQSGPGCRSGVNAGYWNGQPCGECFIKANWGRRIDYAYDLTLSGHLKDAAGQPLANQFVKLRMPNGWTVTTRTTEEGKFYMTLGATEPRRSNTVVTKELGTFTTEKATRVEDSFTFYMLPEQFAACSEGKK